MTRLRHSGVNFINILCAHFLSEVLAPKFTKLCFGFEIFWRKIIGAKCTHKMLTKLTIGCCVWGICDENWLIKFDSKISWLSFMFIHRTYVRIFNFNMKYLKLGKYCFQVNEKWQEMSKHFHKVYLVDNYVQISIGKRNILIDCLFIKCFFFNLS